MRDMFLQVLRFFYSTSTVEHAHVIKLQAYHSSNLYRMKSDSPAKRHALMRANMLRGVPLYNFSSLERVLETLPSQPVQVRRVICLQL